LRIAAHFLGTLILQRQLTHQASGIELSR